MISQLSCKSNKRTKSKTNKKPHGSGAARGGWSLGPDLGRWEEWVGVQGPAKLLNLPLKVLHYLLARQSGRPHAISSGIQYEKVTTTNIGLKECSSKYKHIFLILAELIR